AGDGGDASSINDRPVQCRAGCVGAEAERRFQRAAGIWVRGQHRAVEDREHAMTHRSPFRRVDALTYRQSMIDHCRTVPVGSAPTRNGGLAVPLGYGFAVSTERSIIANMRCRTARPSAALISAPNCTGRTWSLVTSKKPTVNHTANTLLRVVMLLAI